MIMADYGGVLADHHQQPAESELAGLLGIDIPKCRAFLSERSEQGRRFREDGITETEFWDRVALLAGISETLRPADAVLSRLWAETYRLNAEVFKILLSYRPTAAIGILTNVDPARSRYLTDVIRVNNLVDIYIPSFAYRATKYSPDLWKKANMAVRRRYPQATVIYVDDRPQHIASCEICGWRGILYEGPPS